MRLLPIVLAGTLMFATSLGAQRPGRLEGVVTDSLHLRPLGGATVLVTRTGAGASDFRSTLADNRGRFRVDSLDAGRYEVTFLHPILDSLELVHPPREVLITEGDRSRVALAIPSGATMRLRACPGVPLASGTGAIVGQVTDAERESPLAGARVALDWMNVAIERATARATLEPRSATAVVDSRGVFRFCGVPTDTYLLLQVQHGARAGSALRVTVPDAAGIAVLRLSFSQEGSRPLTAVDTTSEGEPAVPLAGTASLSGVVRTATGQPLADAVVRVLDAGSASRTDEAGRFSLAALPSGTQVLETRRVGYLLAQQRVELRSSLGSTADVTLRQIVMLDSVRVLAQRSRYRESADRQRRGGGWATYLNEDQIARVVAFETSDLLTRMGGFRVGGSGLDAKLYVQRGHMSIIGGPCPMNIVIDGFQHQDINVVRPGDIGMMEVYKGPAGAPIEYDSACGVVVIWTKR